MHHFRKIFYVRDFCTQAPITSVVAIYDRNTNLLAVGAAHFNPEDKNVVKALGREIATDRAYDAFRLHNEEDKFSVSYNYHSGISLLIRASIDVTNQDARNELNEVFLGQFGFDAKFLYKWIKRIPLDA